MTPENRKLGALAILLLIGVGVAAWNVNWMFERQADAKAAAQDLADCRALAASIEMLRTGPTVASEQDMGVQELGQRIEAASRIAQFHGKALQGVFPQQARRAGDSPYRLKPTALILRGVPLEQLATFLHHLSSDSGLRVQDLRLRSPRGDETGHAWDAEVTLTYLIYDPATERRTSN
jgi:type II secretory pathway component PulM